MMELIFAIVSSAKVHHKGYTFSFATPEQIAECNKNTKKRKRE